jgi:hypothetical protein
VPTTRPRHLVTETDELANALDAAALRWPGLSRAQLLARLALEGHRAASDEQERDRRRKVERVRRHSGSLTGAYEVGYLDRLRDDWPA